MLEIVVRYSCGDVMEEFLTNLDLARIALSFHFPLNNFAANSGTNADRSLNVDKTLENNNNSRRVDVTARCSVCSCFGSFTILNWDTLRLCEPPQIA